MVAGTTYYIRIGGWGGAEGTFDLEILNGSFAQTLAVNGGAPGAGGFSFTDGDTLTFEYFECNPGSFVFNTINYGAGPLPVGATVEIPGFVQTSALSTPVGAIEIMPAVLMVAGASQNLTIRASSPPATSCASRRSTSTSCRPRSRSRRPTR